MIAQQFISSDRTAPKRSKFNNRKELLSLDWVKKYSKNKDFLRFSLNREDSFTTKDGGIAEAQHFLMAEYKSMTKQAEIVAIIRDADITAIDDIPEHSVRNLLGKYYKSL